MLSMTLACTSHHINISLEVFVLLIVTVYVLWYWSVSYALKIIDSLVMCSISESVCQYIQPVNHVPPVRFVSVEQMTEDHSSSLPDSEGTIRIVLISIPTNIQNPPRGTM